MPEPLVPVRLKAMRALEALLKTMTPAAGFTFDMSAAVFRDRAFFGSTDPVPLLVVLEKPVPDQAELGLAAPNRVNAVAVESVLPVIIQGFCATPDDAYFLAAETVKVLVAEVKRGEPLHDLLGLKGSGQMSPVLGLRVGNPVVRPPDGEGASSAYFWLEATLTLAENRLDPFV